ncbi:MAG: hypothetical protein N2111_11315 [Candidatus Sumerlaeaceae bacterium]|nr:hypothetical protein [Candidatus Sumerlaeaceae bacterium]
MIAGPVIGFTGFPQGLDQYHYAAYIQALWRSPTGVTYAYPFALWWEAPPVLFHLPFLVLAWVGRITGLPLAFELMRVAGSAATGAALAGLSLQLFRRTPWAAWLLGMVAAGGAWFWIAVSFHAAKISGAAGFTEPWAYLRLAMGPFFSWLPFVGQNVVYPLECFYHALVIGCLWCLISRQYFAAYAINLATWLSNPFPSLSLNSAVVPWLAFQSVASGSRASRREAGCWLGLWVTAGLAAYGYYHLFLGQWEITREAARLHIRPLASPPTMLQSLCLLMPFSVGLFWSVASRAGRHHIWGKAAWSLFAMLALSQIAILHHGHWFGERAFQPYHFNRGYLHMGLCVIFLRCLIVITRRPRLVPRWCVVLMLTVFPDQALWLTQYVLTPQTAGLADRDSIEAVTALSRIPQRRIVVSDGYITAPLVSALTHHEPYNIPQSIFVPFAAERQRLLNKAMAESDIRFTDLGITLAVVMRDGRMHRALLAEDWTQRSAYGFMVVLEAPVESIPQAAQ